MMILPASKLLTVVPTVTFTYSFQYLNGSPTSMATNTTVTPFNLSQYTPLWTVTWATGQTVYTTQTATQDYPVIGQVGELGSFPGNLQLGMIGSDVSLLMPSGVYLGGSTNDPSNGIVQLFLSATDTTTLAWQNAFYTFAIVDPYQVSTVLLAGNIATIGSLPTNLPGAS